MKSIKNYLDPFVFNPNSDLAKYRGGLNAIDNYLGEKARPVCWWLYIDYPSNNIKNHLMLNLKESVN